MYQEDAAAVHALQIPPKEMQTTLKKIGVDWDPALAGNEFLAGQVAFFGIYDG
jgi:protein phosphatase PTC6